MKEWIIELCPEITGWQAEMIAEAAESRIKKAVAQEREECAKYLEGYAIRFDDIRSAALEVAAEHLRARGQK